MNRGYGVRASAVALASAAAALTILLGGCVQAADVSAQKTTDSPAVTDGEVQAAPARPVATLPNPSGRTYEGQKRTFVPEPREIAPEDIPAYPQLEFDFDSKSPGFSLFHPCKELTPEVYARIGLVMKEDGYEDPEVASCNLIIETEEVGEGVLVSSDFMTHAMMEAAGHVMGDATDSVVPGALYANVRGPHDRGKSCEAYVSTPRGRLAILYSKIDGSGTYEELCPVARDYFEKFVALPEVQKAVWGREVLPPQ